jgi:hypothetical protein
MPSHSMWGDAKFSPSISKGMQDPKVVRLPLVEKVRVLRGCVLLTRREGERPFSPDLKSLGAQKSGTSGLEDPMLIVMPYQVGPRMAQRLRGQTSRSTVWFPGGSWVPCGMVHYPEGSLSDRWPPSFLSRNGGAIPGTGCPTPIILLLVELVMSR